MNSDLTDRVRDHTVGIVGFGKVGTVLARLAHGAGYRVVVAGSGDPAGIALTAEVLAPGVRTAWTSEAVETADIVILAIPLRAHVDLPPDLLAGKVVVDAVNHWLEVDGPRDLWLDPAESSSEHLQRVFPGARLVKGFNHLGYHDLDERARPAGARERIAVALASDDPAAAATVAELVDDLGFDPLRIGPLRTGRVLEPGSPAFGAVLTAKDLTQLVTELRARSSADLGA